MTINVNIYKSTQIYMSSEVFMSVIFRVLCGLAVKRPERCFDRIAAVLFTLSVCVCACVSAADAVNVFRIRCTRNSVATGSSAPVNAAIQETTVSLSVKPAHPPHGITIHIALWLYTEA